MVTVKITVEFERDGERVPFELSREEAETLHAELSRALGKGRALGKEPVVLPEPRLVPLPPLPQRVTWDPFAPGRVTCGSASSPEWLKDVKVWS